jgi:muconate cycloisomerase
MSRQSPRIVDLNFTEVIVPTHPGVIDGGMNKPLHMVPVAGKKPWSFQFDELPKLVVELTLSDGTTGWGEFYRDHDWTTVEGIVQGLLGRHIDASPLSDLPVPICREHDGFECAIWDAYSKWLGVPLHRLLGGAVRDRVKVGAWSSHRPIGQVGGVAAKFHQGGYDCIKFKCDLDDDVVGWAREISKSAPGMKIILDPNQRWESAGYARPLIRQLSEVGNILLLEDPIPRWMIQEYAELRRVSPIPIVLHVSLPYVYQNQRPYEALNALTHGAVDGFNFSGGLGRFQEMAALAKIANLPFWHGSEVDLGILEAMYVHQSAASAMCIWPSDIFGRVIRSHDLLEVPLRIEPPFVFVPDGPGLGVTPDRSAIERFAVGGRRFTE